MLKFSEIKKTKIIKGFTLGEMLFVMIIISVLVALTTPVITRRTRTKLPSIKEDIWKFHNATDINYLNNVAIGTTSTDFIYLNNGIEHTGKAKLKLLATGLTPAEAGTAANPQIQFRVKNVDDPYDDETAFMSFTPYNRFVWGSATATVSQNGGIAIGHKAIVNSANSIAIGELATVSSGATSPGVAIGYNALSSHPNSVAIGNDGVKSGAANEVRIGKTDQLVFVAGASFTTSDLNLKNVKGFYKKGIKELRNLKTYTFSFKDDENNTVRAGLIAQDVKKTIPEAINFTDDKAHLGIKNEYINFAIFNAICDVDKSLRNAVKKQIVLNHKIAKQEAQIRRLEREIEVLSKSQG